MTAGISGHCGDTPSFVEPFPDDVQLTTNAGRMDARRFYERLGFEPSPIGMKLRLDER